MDTALTVDASDLFAFAARCANAERVVIAESRMAMERSTILVQNDAKRNLQRQGAIDTGRLLNSIARRVEPFEAEVGTNVTYARPVEEGRRPGAPMPPSGALDGWMARHEIPLEAEFALRRAIARRGIRARPYLVPALEDNQREIDREFQAAAKRIAVKVVG